MDALDIVTDELSKAGYPLKVLLSYREEQALRTALKEWVAWMRRPEFRTPVERATTSGQTTQETTASPCISYIEQLRLNVIAMNDKQEVPYPGAFFPTCGHRPCHICAQLESRMLDEHSRESTYENLRPIWCNAHQMCTAPYVNPEHGCPDSCFVPHPRMMGA